MIPTMIKAAKVVSEKRMLKTTNSTIKGYAEKLILITFEGYKSSFYFSFDGDFDLKSFMALKDYFLPLSSYLELGDFFFFE